MRVDLGDGQWAEVKEPGELRRSDQKAALRASSLVIDPDTQTVHLNGANDQDMADALLERIITSWSFPNAINKQSLGQLSLDQGDKLQEAIKPHLELISAKVDPGKRDTDPTEG